MVKWAKIVGRERDGAPSRSMRRAQGRLIQSIAREAAAPMQAANDACMVVLMGEKGRSDPELLQRLTKPDHAAKTVDEIVELLTPPDTDASLAKACTHYRAFVAAKKANVDPEDTWASYRALVLLQLSVWHHTGVDPSPVASALVDQADSVEEDDCDAIVKSLIAEYVEQFHDNVARSVVRKHGGVEELRKGLGLESGDLRLKTAISTGIDIEPDSDPPRVKDVVEPSPGVLAVVPSLEDDVGDVLEHMQAAEAPAGVPCSKVRWRRNQMDVVIEDDLLRTILRCTCGDLDPSVAECVACGSRDCPHGHELHYHHDGCPACSEEDEKREIN